MTVFFVFMATIILIIAAIFWITRGEEKTYNQTWQEPTDCDSNSCDCASLAHPADSRKPKAMTAPIVRKQKDDEHPLAKRMAITKADTELPKKATKVAKKATKKPAKKAKKSSTMRKKASVK